MRLTDASFQAITRFRYLGGQKPVLWAVNAAGVTVHVRHISIADLGALEFHRVTGWWAQFDAWMGWIDGKKKAPRPKVWRLVPRFAWTLRGEILKARKPVGVPAPPTPPPVPPLPPQVIPYSNLIFAAQNPLAAVVSKSKYRILYTADPGYDAWATAGSAEQAQAAGHEHGVWYVPTQVSKERADEVARRLGTDFIVGQAETLDEFRASVAHGRKAVVGNLSSCFFDDEVQARLKDGSMVFVNEFYWNQAKYRQPDNHSLPVASMCIATYDGHADGDPNAAWDPTAQDYKSAGYWWNTMSAYGPGMTADDYRLLP